MNSMNANLTVRLSIEALVAEFAFHLDRGAGQRAADLFAEDGKLITLAPPYDGTQSEIVEGRARLADRWNARGEHTIRHLFTNLRVVADADDRATGTSSVIAFRHVGKDRRSADIFLVTDWHDKYCLGSDGIWRFSERRIEPVFWGDKHFADLFTR